MKNTKRMQEKVNAIVDEILDENQGNDFNATRSESCPRDCEEPDDTPKEVSYKKSFYLYNNYLNLNFIYIFIYDYNIQDFICIKIMI